MRIKPETARIVRPRWSRWLETTLKEAQITEERLARELTADVEKDPGGGYVRLIRDWQSKAKTPSAASVSDAGEHLYRLGAAWTSRPVALHAAGYFADLVGLLAVLVLNSDDRRAGAILVAVLPFVNGDLVSHEQHQAPPPGMTAGTVALVQWPAVLGASIDPQYRAAMQQLSAMLNKSYTERFADCWARWLSLRNRGRELDQLWRFAPYIRHAYDVVRDMSQLQADLPSAEDSMFTLLESWWKGAIQDVKFKQDWLEPAALARHAAKAQADLRMQSFVEQIVTGSQPALSRVKRPKKTVQEETK